ncbi:MAG: protein kinase [Cyanobacteriota/Melainabacteria group bacterium]
MSNSSEKELEKDKEPVLKKSPAESVTGEPESEAEEKKQSDFPKLDERFEVIEELGAGGMGRVFKVRDLTLDKLLAIKVLKQDLANDATALKRFEKEAEAAAALSHPNLISIYNHGTTSAGESYLVMDYLEGPSLAEVIEKKEKLGTERLLDIFIQICDGLAHAHKAGVIHRDVKPTNIILTKSESGKDLVKIVDFGIARVMDASVRETHDLTQTGEVFGSPQYMSPEQCLGLLLREQSDIYSLGCTLYETITGNPPFAGSNPIQLVVKHINDDVEGFSREHLDSKQKKQLETVTLKCLAKEMDDRYSSVEALKEDLEKIKEGKPIQNYAVRSKAKPTLTKRQMLIILPVLLGVFCYSLFALISMFGDKVGGRLLNGLALLIFSPGVYALYAVANEKFKSITSGQNSRSNWWHFILAITAALAGAGILPMFFIYLLTNNGDPLFCQQIIAGGMLLHFIMVPFLISAALGWLFFRGSHPASLKSIAVRYVAIMTLLMVIPVCFAPQRVGPILGGIGLTVEKAFPGVSAELFLWQARMSGYEEDLVHELARKLQELKQFDAAAKLLEEGLAQVKDPRQVAFYLIEMAQVEKQRKNLERALDYATRAAKIDSPHRQDALREKAMILLDLNRLDEAKAIIIEYLTTNTDNHRDRDVLTRGVNKLCHAGRYKDAIDLLNKFIASHPDYRNLIDVQARLIRALINEHLGNWPSALADYNDINNFSKNKSVNSLGDHFTDPNRLFSYAAFKTGLTEFGEGLMKTIGLGDGLNLDHLKSLLGLAGTDINMGDHMPESFSGQGGKQ